MGVRVSQVVLSSGLAVSYASTGRPSGPALLMLPGPTDSWRSYAAVLEELPSSMRSIAVSQRGHGDTDKPPAGNRVEDFAADVPLILDSAEAGAVAGSPAAVGQDLPYPRRPATVTGAAPTAAPLPPFLPQPLVPV